jgi:hypothetical protein
MAGKQIGEFSFKLTSLNFSAGPAGSVIIQVNCEGTATGFGTVAGTLATIPGKSGTFSWCGAAYLDDGGLVTSTGSGVHESVGKHRWRTRGDVVISDGRTLSAEGELTLADRSWSGKLFEK